MKTLADNVELDGSFTPEDVRNMLIDDVNRAWSQKGNDARCTVTANFIAWILLENDRLRARAAELEAENTQLGLCLRDNGSTKPLFAKGRTPG